MKKHRGKVSWNTPKFSREWNSYLEIFSFPGLEVYTFLSIIFFTDITETSRWVPWLIQVSSVCILNTINTSWAEAKDTLGKNNTLKIVLASLRYLRNCFSKAAQSCGLLSSQMNNPSLNFSSTSSLMSWKMFYYKLLLPKKYKSNLLKHVRAATGESQVPAFQSGLYYMVEGNTL